MALDPEKGNLGQASLSHESLSMATSTEKPHDAHDEDHEATGHEDVESGDLERHLSRKSSKKQGLAVEIYPLMDLDKGLVGWESQDDPLNPRNFPSRQKWFIIALFSAITLLAPLASSIIAPAISFINHEFHNTSRILGSLAVSIFILGFSFGPLVLSPLSEIYGRKIVLNFSNVFFCAFSLGCALAPNMSALLVFRVLEGIGGSACLTLGAGVISDLFIAEERGKAMAIYSLGVLWGPVLGPIIGGFIAQRAGWRWDFWVVFIASVLLSIGIFILNKETNPVVLMDWKATQLRQTANRPDLRNVYTHTKSEAELRRRVILRRGFGRPLQLLFTSPIVFLLSLYVSFVFGLLYLLFTTITAVFMGTYGWSPEICGLSYMGLGIGCFGGIIFVAKTSDATIIRLAKRNNGVYEPEMRLPACVFFGMLIPVGLFWYGWSTDQKVHWIVPILGLVPFGFGMMGLFTPIQTYLIDSFPRYAASAVAGLTAMRCLFGAVLPLAGPNMYASLGLGWGNSLLGFIAVAMIPVPALIYKYGGYIRKRWPVEL